MQKDNSPVIDEMFKAGAHFGYSKSRRHPSTAKYIFATKNKVDIIDLEKTEELLASAEAFMKSLGATGKQVLMVGVKPEAKATVGRAAAELVMPYVTERWVGGILTNFSEIKKRIARLEDLREQKEKGELEKYTKKERLLIDREVEKMNTHFGGLVTLKKMPDALLVVDPKREYIAVAEARVMGVPVIALLNTDCDIKNIDHPILGNDASMTSIAYFVDALAEAYRSGLAVRPEAAAA